MNGHDANFVVTGDTAGCRYDNLQRHQWRKVGIMTSLGCYDNLNCHQWHKVGITTSLCRYDNLQCH